METNDEVELGNYWRIFRRSWWMIALAVLFMTALALVFLPRQDNFFNSNVSVLLRPGDADVGPVGDPVNEDTEIGIATSPLIGTRVIEQVPELTGVDNLTLDRWLENLEITCLDSGASGVNRCDSQILEFSYNGDTADEASQIVQATASEYLDFRTEREGLLRTSQADEIRGQLENLQGRIANETEVLQAAQDAAQGERTLDVTSSEDRLRQLESQLFETQLLLGNIQEDNFEVGNFLGSPSNPEADATGIPRLFTLIAGILMGFIVGALAAILTDRLDRRISGPIETELDLGVPVLGNIPRITEDSPALVAALGQDSPGAESFRRLAAAVLAPRDGFVVDSIAVTGATEKDGRTTAAINLALAISQTGRNVLLVGADRRNDALDRVFGIAGRSGLSDFLRTSGGLEAARAAIDMAEIKYDLTILPTGTGVPSPIANNSVAALLAIAQERNMIVVFDAPPALTNAEGLQLAAIVDAVYVVSAIGRTKRSELRNLRIQLENVQADLAGAILNRTSRLNLLPTGSGDVGSVTVPSGVPGNNRRDLYQDSSAVHHFGRNGDASDASRMGISALDPHDAEIISERPIDPDEFR